MFLSLSAAREELQCYYILFRVPCCPVQMNRDEPSVTTNFDVRVVLAASSTMLSCPSVRKQKLWKKNPKTITKTGQWDSTDPSFQLESGVKAYYSKCHSFAIFKEASLKACAPHYVDYAMHGCDSLAGSFALKGKDRPDEASFFPLKLARPGEETPHGSKKLRIKTVEKVGNF